MEGPRVVAITGASAGVGRATAVAFAREGASVGLIARGEGRLESARRELAGLGARAVAVSTDVADPEAVESAAERIEVELGPIDVWVNNAMERVLLPAVRAAAAGHRDRRSRYACRGQDRQLGPGRTALHIAIGSSDVEFLPRLEPAAPGDDSSAIAIAPAATSTTRLIVKARARRCCVFASSELRSVP